MNEKKVTARAKVQLTVEIETGGLYGEDWTNTKPSDFSFYEEYAKGAGYQIISLVVEKRHENKNSHNVPQETLDRQELNIRKSLKLQ